VVCGVPPKVTHGAAPQENAGNSTSITFQQFSVLLRLPIPSNLAKFAALQRNVLVQRFVSKLRAAVAARRAQLSPPGPSCPSATLPKKSGVGGSLPSTPVRTRASSVQSAQGDALQAEAAAAAAETPSGISRTVS
jgi:hypothetical protein